MTRAEIITAIGATLLILALEYALQRWLPIDPRYLTRGI